MKCAFIVFATLCLGMSGHAQTAVHDIDPSQLQQLLDLPLAQAVNAREAYKVALRAAYKRQMALVGKDCEEAQGQQPYNICMGNTTDVVDSDYAAFYNNLQMLCHDQAQLTALQNFEKSRKVHTESAMKAARAAWSEGTGAPGFQGGVYVTMVRNSMQELATIYDLNISQ